MTRSLGWGVVGIGNIVRGTIAPILVAEPSCTLAAATSRDRGRADEFAVEFGIPRAYVDYDEMLADPQVAAVYIATPNAQHADQVVRAARAGKHVLCDKPLAIDVAGAVRAVRACAAAGVQLGITFHNRFLPWVQEVRRVVEDGRIGDVQVVHLEVGAGTRHYSGWRSDPAHAGLGSVHNVGVHGLDVLRVILQAEPVEVAALFDRTRDQPGVEMLGLLLLRFDRGALVYVNCNETVAYPRNDITIYGSEGRIVGAGLTRARRGGRLTITTRSGDVTTLYPAPGAHRLLVAAFAAAVLRGEQPSPSGLDGLRSVQLCAAIDRSVRERRVVDVDDAPAIPEEGGR